MGFKPLTNYQNTAPQMTGGFKPLKNIGAIQQPQIQPQPRFSDNSWQGIAKNTITGIPSAVKQVGMQAIKNPLDTLKAMGSGVVKGISPLMRLQQVYANPASLIPSIRNQSLANIERLGSYRPQNQVSEGVKGGFEFSGAQVPYMIGGQVARYLPFAIKAPRLANYLGWIGTSQAISDKKITDIKGRGQQAALDSLMFALFGGLKKPKGSLPEYKSQTPEILPQPAVPKQVEKLSVRSPYNAIQPTIPKSVKPLQEGGKAFTDKVPEGKTVFRGTMGKGEINKIIAGKGDVMYQKNYGSLWADTSKDAEKYSRGFSQATGMASRKPIGNEPFLLEGKQLSDGSVVPIKATNLDTKEVINFSQSQGITPKAGQSLKQGVEGIKKESASSDLGLMAEPKVSTEARMATPAQKIPQARVQEVSSKLNQDVSFEATIRRSATDVNSKVNVLDMFRTPDRVLKKIGMENEANLIRKQYDKYIAEVPEEIKKIDVWKSQVTPKGNVKIFKFLDGQKVALSSQELKVANEIKTYLKNWADKLGLPEDNRITNYITHIFEKDFIKKEFPDELAKVISDKVAGSVYDPFVIKRLGKLGYVEDTFRALEAYAKRASRKVNMDVALEQVKKKANTLELSQYKYVKNYIDRVNMRPTDIDNMFDNFIKSIAGYRFGGRPTTAITRAGRQWVYRGTLGLNVSSALKNLSQGANTYAKLGEKYTLLGYAKLLKNWRSGELEKVGVLSDSFIQDRTLSTSRKFLQKFDKTLMSLFQGAEKINRGAAYFGAKSKAIAAGKTEQEAIEYAKKIVRDTQFTFGSIDTPPVLQSDIGKTLGQFQSFTIKQAEFLTEMMKNKEWLGLSRWIGSSLFFIYAIGKSFGMEPKDLIPTFRIGVPPTLGLPVQIGKAIIKAPNQYGQPTGWDEIKRAALPFVSAGIQGKKVLEGLSAYNKGYVENAGGKVQYPVGTKIENLIRGLLFGKYNLPGAQEYFNKPTPLSENQSELFKQLPPEKQQEYYKFIQENRGANQTKEEQHQKMKEMVKEGMRTGNNDLIKQAAQIDPAYMKYIFQDIVKEKKESAIPAEQRMTQEILKAKRLNPFYQ